MSSPQIVTNSHKLIWLMKAHCTMDYLNEQAFQIMEWPLYSPDMNPIEHLWAVLKKELHRCFSDIKDLPRGSAAVK